MRVFSIILADDEQQILYGMKKELNGKNLDFVWPEWHRMGKKHWN